MKEAAPTESAHILYFEIFCCFKLDIGSCTTKIKTLHNLIYNTKLWPELSSQEQNHIHYILGTLLITQRKYSEGIAQLEYILASKEDSIISLKATLLIAQTNISHSHNFDLAISLLENLVIPNKPITQPLIVQKFLLLGIAKLDLAILSNAINLLEKCSDDTLDKRLVVQGLCKYIDLAIDQKTEKTKIVAALQLFGAKIELLEFSEQIHYKKEQLSFEARLQSQDSDSDYQILTNGFTSLLVDFALQKVPSSHTSLACSSTPYDSSYLDSRKSPNF